MSEHKILTDAEIGKALADLPDWSLNAPNIEAQFEFTGFRDAIAFIVQVAIEAEVMNHHPEFHNSWNRVSSPSAPTMSETRSPTPTSGSPSGSARPRDAS